MPCYHAVFLSYILVQGSSWIPSLKVLMCVVKLFYSDPDIVTLAACLTHAALLDQACAHCPIFPTAASRRSLGRVSVPVWLIILSNQLLIVALVGFYPTN